MVKKQKPLAIPADASPEKRAMLKRIKEGLDEKELSPQAASLKAGLGKDVIRDLFRKSKTMPTIDTVAALAPVLSMPPETLAWGKNRRRALTKTLAMPVRGEVAAGLWLEISGSDEPEFESFAVPFHVDYPPDAQYGLIVRGTSINRQAQPGDILQCLDVGISGATPQENELVIVERRRAQAGQKEVTAKVYRRKGPIIELVPDSTDERWSEPLVLDPRHAKDDEEIAIIAIVIGTYRPRKRR